MTRSQISRIWIIYLKMSRPLYEARHNADRVLLPTRPFALNDEQRKDYEYP